MMQYQETLTSPRGFSSQEQSLLKVSCVPNICFHRVKTGQLIAATLSDFAVKLTDLIDMSLPQSMAHVSAVHSGLLVFQSATDYFNSNRKSQVTAMTGAEASRWCPHDEEEYSDKSALFGHVALLSFGSMRYSLTGDVENGE